MKLELLYFDDCPNFRALEPRLRRVLDGAGVKDEIRLRRVASNDEALQLRFLGSPTVRVDGRDVEPEAEERRDWGLKCRLYRRPMGLLGTPGDDVILAALERARSQG